MATRVVRHDGGVIVLDDAVAKTLVKDGVVRPVTEPAKRTETEGKPKPKSRKPESE